VIDGVVKTTVFGLGQSIRITGTVKEGAIAFGGDVIVEGSVDGDVAAIGGSVIQREGSRIGGDVIVLGGGLSRIERLYEAVPRRWGAYAGSYTHLTLPPIYSV